MAKVARELMYVKFILGRHDIILETRCVHGNRILLAEMFFRFEISFSYTIHVQNLNENLDLADCLL